MGHDVAEETRRRKEDHLRIPLERDVQSIPNPWDAIHLRHEALPTVDRDQVDLSTTFLGHDLAAPVQITGMTGGAPKAQEINAELAKAAAEHGVAMGVGSQRAAIENPELAETYTVILDHEVPVRFANLGLPQIIAWGDQAAAHAETAIEMVDAHALCIHLNALQEAVMPEGDTDWSGSLEAITHLCKDLNAPIIVKETGAGIDGETAQRLVEAGAAAIDVGGLGGTSFAAVEHHRAQDTGDSIHARMGETYWAWGNPTPDCIVDVRDALPAVPLVATGGLRHGLDALRALTLGADLAGFAGTMFRAAAAQKAAEELIICLEELKTGIYLSGSAGVQDLRPVPP